jgi:predicted esterase
LSPAFRYLFFTLGLLLAVPLLSILYLSLGIPISPIGIVYLVAYSLLVLGLIGAPWFHQWGLIMSLTGIAILLLTASVRILFPPSGSQMNLIILPGPSSPRLLTRVFDEQDIVLFGAKIAPSVGFVSSREYKDLIPQLAHTYQKMRKERVTPLSPTLTTYLGWQHPSGFDALIANPSAGNPETGIIFLHGFGGNFTLQCWLIAEAGRHMGAITLCPSTDPSGQWWKDEGTSILHESINDLKQRGIKRIYLAGLSNGGIGSSRLADRFKNELAGLILISGADPNAAMTGLPVLVISGRNDERIPIALIEQYVSVAGPDATYVPFDGDHFLLLKQTEQVQETITDWIMEQEKQSQGNP